jgi:putative spermidine/putrescine transport system ATP-binding protein
MTQTRSAQRMTQTLTGMDLTFAYDGRDVLRGVTVSVRAGRVTAVIGPSGSGKTTLLWILAGLLPPKSGRVVVADTPDDAPLSIGMVFQGSALWEHLTATEHLWLVLAGKGLARSDRRRRVDETLAKLRLATLGRRRPGQLSGGERRRLAIARALVADPAWLFLDEPLVHLDGPTRAEVFELLRETLTGVHAGVLMATHDAAEAMRLADEIVVLTDGAVAQQGTPEAVYRRPVSLEVARLLGPAGELAGNAAGGVLTSGGRAVLKDVPASLRGPQRLILRPEDVAFRAAPDGTATVRRCDFDGRDFLLTIDAGGTDIFIRHAEKIAAGTAGWLHLAAESILRT